MVKGHRTRAAKKTGHNLHKYKVHSTRKWNNASRTRPCLPIYNAAYHPGAERDWAGGKFERTQWSSSHRGI